MTISRSDRMRCSSNISASFNVALGTEGLFANKSGVKNVAVGPFALRANTSGADNVAAGYNALRANKGGAGNVAAGTAALYRSTGSRNVALGRSAGEDLTTGSDNIDLSNRGVAAESGKIRIGTAGTHTAAFLAGVSGVSIAGPTQSVLVNANGQLGTATASSRKLKTDIRPLRSQLPALFALEPVSYRYKGARNRQFGLIAEDVARVLPELVQYDEQGKPGGVHYDELPRCCSHSPNVSRHACIASRPAPTASNAT